MFLKWLCFWIFTISSEAHELGRLREKSGYFSSSAAEAIHLLRSENLQSWENKKKQHSKSCPQFNALLEKVKNQLLNAVPSRPSSLILMPLCQSWEPRANFFSGGKIELTGGLLRLLQSEDEVAFLLAHEIAHSLLAHDEEQIVRHAKADVFFSNFDQDKEADLTALELVVAAGYNPFAATDSLQKMPIPRRYEQALKERIENLEEDMSFHGFKRIVSSISAEFQSARREVSRFFKW